MSPPFMTWIYRHAPWLGVLAMVLFTALAYAPVTRNGFIWDDDANITQNPVIQSPGGLREIWSITKLPEDRRHPAASQYFPITHTTTWLQWQIHGAWAPGYHIVNVALHLAGAFVMWAILRQLGLSALAAWLAALLYVLHPVAVESVAWATERKNTVSNLFFFLSFWCYLKFFLMPAPSLRAAGKARHTYIVASVLFVAAILSKTNMCVLPAVLGVVLWAKQGAKITKAQVLQLLPLFALGLVFGVVAVYREYNVVGKFEEEFRHNGIERLLMVTHTPWMYLSKALWPHPIMFFYPKWDINAAVFWQYLPGPLLLGVLITLFMLRQRITPWPFAALLCYLIAIAPFAGFFDAFAFRYSLYADHWQYLALPAITPLMAWLLVKGMTMATPMLRGLAVSIAIVAIVLFTTQTHRLTYKYKDITTLWLKVIQENPTAWIAYSDLSVIANSQGRFEESIALLREALRYADVEELRVNIAVSLAAVGRLDESEKHLLAAIAKGEQRGQPAFLAMYNLAGLKRKQGRPKEAMEIYATILEKKPGYFDAVMQLGDMFVQAGRVDLAKERFETAAAMMPDSPEAQVRLAQCHAELGDFRRAREHAARAMALRPGWLPAERLYGMLSTMPASPKR